jgi:hypothetical protein
MTKIILFFSLTAFLLFGCLSTPEERENTDDIISGIMKFEEGSNENLQLLFDSPFRDDSPGFINVYGYSEGEKIFESSSSFSSLKGVENVIMRKGNPAHTFSKDKFQSRAFFHIKMTKMDDTVFETLISGKSLLQGVPFTLFEDVNKNSAFTYPSIEHNLSESPAPPTGFEKREGEEGIGIIDFSFSSPLWFYSDTTLEQIIELMGKEPDKYWPKGSEGLGQYKFNTKDGGANVFDFNENGLWMIYPRNTLRFTLIGFPQLPWEFDTIYNLFGIENAKVVQSNAKETIFPFQGPGGREIGAQPSNLNGFRFDISDGMVSGFRIWMPKADIHTQ